MAPELEGRVRTRKPLLLVGMSKRQAASVVLSVHSRKLWMKYNKYSMMNHNTLCELVLLLDQLVVVMWLWYPRLLLVCCWCLRYFFFLLLFLLLLLDTGLQNGPPKKALYRRNSEKAWVGASSHGHLARPRLSWRSMKSDEMPSCSLLLTLSMLGNVWEYLGIAGSSTSNCWHYTVTPALEQNAEICGVNIGLQQSET